MREFEEKYPKLRLIHPTRSVEQAVELVRRSVLTEMDGRDLARCLALEHDNQTAAYCVSMEKGAIYDPRRHLTANFNRTNFVRDFQAYFPGVKFRQIILDYFWIPKGSWAMSHWRRSFFTDTLPNFVTLKCFEPEDVLIDKACVYLPFCLHCAKQVIAAEKILSKHYQMSFLTKSELSEHDLWTATNTIEPSAMQNWLGKAIAQEDLYCTFAMSEAVESMECEFIDKETLSNTLLRIKDFSNVRMIKLKVLSGDQEGGFVGLGERVKVKKKRRRVPVCVPSPQRNVKAKVFNSNSEFIKDVRSALHAVSKFGKGWKWRANRNDIASFNDSIAKKTGEDPSLSDNGSMSGDNRLWFISGIYSASRVIQSPAICQSDDCHLVACSQWLADDGETWQCCLDCQHDFYGGFPMEKDDIAAACEDDVLMAVFDRNCRQSKVQEYKSAGRWSNNEKRLLVIAREFFKNKEEVSNFVESRSVEQIDSFAETFFSRTAAPIALKSKKNNNAIQKEETNLCAEYIRKYCIEIFVANEDDLSVGHFKGYKVGRVGMRCKHCSHLPPNDRAPRNTVFPNSIGGFIYAYSNWFKHLMECTHISSEIQKDVADLSSCRYQSTITSYFLRLFDELGLVNAPGGDGIRASGRTDLQEMADQLIDGKDGDDASSLTTASLTSSESCLHACANVVNSPQSYARMHGITENVTPSSLEAFVHALNSNKENTICDQFKDAFSKEYSSGKTVAKELFLGNRVESCNECDEESDTTTVESDPMVMYGDVDYSRSQNPLYDFTRDVCLELFVATEKDVAELACNQVIKAGGFGIRCKFCSKLPRGQCRNRAVAYPKNPLAFGRFYSRWKVEHLLSEKDTKMKRCQMIPVEVVKTYRYLEKIQPKSSCVEYWTHEIKGFGYKVDAHSNEFEPIER